MNLLREIRRRIIDALYVLVVGVTRTQLEYAKAQRELWERFLREAEPAMDLTRPYTPRAKGAVN